MTLVARWLKQVKWQRIRVARSCQGCPRLLHEVSVLARLEVCGESVWPVFVCFCVWGVFG